MLDPTTLILKVGYYMGKSIPFKEKFSASQIFLYKKWNGDVHKGGDIATIVKIKGKYGSSNHCVLPKVYATVRQVQLEEI